MNFISYKDSGRDPNNDSAYRRPRGWFNAKRALGGGLVKFLEQFERGCGGCPRLMLCVALGHYLSMSSADRYAAFLADCDRADVDHHFNEAMEKMGFTQGDVTVINTASEATEIEGGGGPN